MGIIEFFVFAVIVCVLGWAAIYALGALTPGHPPQIDRIIWFVVVIVIVLMLVRAMGLLPYDPQIPRVR